ncbi:SET domain-containing protein [Ditylenchus destructor]|nr:SET domain-containing protein [Ditylenchus destructor]
MSSDLAQMFQQTLLRGLASQNDQSPPKPRDRRKREKTLQEFEHQKLNAIQAKHGKVPLRHTFVTGQEHCCVVPMERLKPITLKEMLVPKVHKGRYLVCQTLTQAVAYVGTTVPIEDLEGEVEMLSLYNFRMDISDGDWLQPGTILVIKEPYLKHGSQSESAIIRVDSPSDVVFVKETDENFLRSIEALCWHKPALLSAEELRLKGNKFFAQNHFEKALDFYDRALLLEPNSAVVQLNRSAVLIKMQRFYDSYESAQMALKNGADEEKALFRLGVAAYGMREWEKSVHHFRSLRDKFPANKAAKDDLGKAQIRLQEFQAGSYNFDQLFHQVFKEKKRFLDVSDYNGPIEISEIPRKGKGIIASKDIKKGTLLMVSKAFSMIYDEDFTGIDLLSTNLITKIADMKCSALNVIGTVQTLLKNPQRADELYALHTGKNFEEASEIPKGVIDVGRIEKICSMNGFEPENVFETADDSKTDDTDTKFRFRKPAGLWTTPSYFNHSCIGNSHRTFFGDVMVIHAICDLKKGEEITHNYVSPTIPYKERAKTLERYGFKCDCELCESERNDPAYERRLRLWHKIMPKDVKIRVDEEPKKYLDFALPLAQKFRETYTLDSKVRIHLFKPLTAISSAYQTIGDYENSAKILEEAFNCLGEKYECNLGVEILLQLAECLTYIGYPDAAQDRVVKAIKIMKVRSGVGKNVFLQIHPHATEILNL